MVYDPGLTGDKQQLINKTATILPILIALHGRSLVKSVRLRVGLVYENVSNPFTCCLLVCRIFFFMAESKKYKNYHTRSRTFTHEPIV